MQRINQMLLEMASGNFFYRLERSTKNDNIEALGLTLNILAEEIQETMLHQGYVNSNSTIMEVIQMSFILDEKGQIQMVNQQTCNILSVLHTDIIGGYFTDFLTETSLSKWQDFWKTGMQKEFSDTSFELTFKTKGNLVIPKTCHITTFNGKNNDERKVLITVIHHSNRQDKLENELKRSVFQFNENHSLAQDETQIDSRKPKLRLSFEDIRKIREGHDIIINNLEKELPSLKDFALQLGTNEFKLKYGFKELYGTSVYRFLTAERLRKAKMMIQYTDQSLKSIAHMTGFKSISHFSRTFKKRYEYTPSDLRKKSLNRDE
ncbi:helix-turn-helix domain-containing protein [Seonamhaeicola maritimus]|uniref:Helix-turn-helix domain-containing protein n=1 Tax=Seonamhaeicola maritimus TaxID=2591822 RepID=A0A5C7GM46_9FLAO|nr:helix-turn-helix domain-containing protein [Seonamhaeicola maritimus]TXG39576.1 helix-turn-helix domain-containing protein [Seonamhaeicola maritimus]